MTLLLRYLHFANIVSVLDHPSRAAFSTLLRTVVTEVLSAFLGTYVEMETMLRT